MLLGKHSFTLSKYSSIDSLKIRIDQFGYKIDHLHIPAHLNGDLFEHLFSKIATSNSFLKSDKLDDITLRLHIFVIFKDLVIRVQLDHHIEIFGANTNNNNRTRKF